MLIPESIPEIKDLIQRKTQDILFWMDKKNQSRKPSLLTMRAMHEQRCRDERKQLEKALDEAIEKANIEKARAFVAKMAPLRKQWEDGFFD